MNIPSDILRFTRSNRAQKKTCGHLISAALCGLIFLLPYSAQAHGFAYKYDLPLPLNLYLAGSVTIVFLSFLALLLWKNRSSNLSKFNLTFDLAGRIPYRIICLIKAALGIFSIFLFLNLLIIGFIGSQNTLKNLLPVSVWVLWWVGFIYFSALCMNTWNLLNPWAFCFEIVEKLLGKEIKYTAYPNWLSYWPSFLFLSLFLWVELIWPNKESPAALATLIIWYSLTTWIGMAVFGRKTWSKYAEFFSVFFSLLSRFAPLHISDDGKRICIRPHGFGILNARPHSMGLVLIIMLLLAGLSFDGFMATDPWVNLQAYVLQIDSLKFTFKMLYQWFGDLEVILSTAGLILTLLLFLGVYTLVCAITTFLLNKSSVTGNPQISLHSVIQHFILTLLPIAIGYHVAHYLSYLLIAGQLVIPLMSDPYNLSWNLFGTNDYRIDIGIINARTVWSVTLISIIIGHVLSIFLSHARTLQLGSINKPALVQIPLVTLMIFYTGISLWILAQPIVEN